MNENAGITRINITDHKPGAGANRFAAAPTLWPAANNIYRETFAALGMPLAEGEESIECTSDEFQAGYDRKYGTDLWLRFESGMRSSMQEKYLTTDFTTVTVEYWQNWRTRERGDWFTMRVDYYFVGYHLPGGTTMQRWILLDWPAVQRATSRNLIVWGDRRNGRDGAQSSFRYAEFSAFPPECVVAGVWPGRQ